MSDSLSTGEIKNRGISGAKWLVVMNGLGMPAAFLIALMLGRVGPESLGAYALAQILIGVITTFVVYGGPPVLSVFMPKLAGAAERGRFVFSYLTILLASMTIVLGLFWLFPTVLEFLLQRDFDMRKYGWFVLLAFVIVATETFANAASGLMLIKLSAIARQMMRLVLLPLVAILFFTRRDLLTEHAMPIILGGFLAGYLAAAAICLIGISRDHRFAVRPGWLVPRGFWTFSLSATAASVFSFLYANFDRMAVLAIQDIEGLGMYQAVLSINKLLERIPALFLPSVIPTFSSLLSGNHHSAFKGGFSILCRWSVVPITAASLLVMGFSREILDLFGTQYLEYASILTLFGMVGIIRSLNLGTGVITTCMEKNTFRFLQQFSMILAQGALTIAVMSDYGVMAIAGAKMVSVSAASFAAVLYVFFVPGMGGRLPRSYAAALSVGCIMTVLRIWVVPPGWMSAAALSFSCIGIFLIISRLRWQEIQGLFKLVFYRDVASLIQAAGIESEDRSY